MSFVDKVLFGFCDVVSLFFRFWSIGYLLFNLVYFDWEFLIVLRRSLDFVMVFFSFFWRFVVFFNIGVILKSVMERYVLKWCCCVDNC